MKKVFNQLVAMVQAAPKTDEAYYAVCDACDDALFSNQLSWNQAKALRAMIVEHFA